MHILATSFNRNSLSPTNFDHPKRKRGQKKKTDKPSSTRYCNKQTPYLTATNILAFRVEADLRHSQISIAMVLTRGHKFSSNSNTQASGLLIASLPQKEKANSCPWPVGDTTPSRSTTTFCISILYTCTRMAQTTRSVHSAVTTKARTQLCLPALVHSPSVRPAHSPERSQVLLVEAQSTYCTFFFFPLLLLLLRCM